ncbi:MAG: chloride channel protein [Parvibaculaceae bacterium]|nr:chloride channel protein [Parvibaculaceae bacterium]
MQPPPADRKTKRFRYLIRTLRVRSMARLRAFRNEESARILACAGVGAFVGMLVMALREFVYKLHEWVFQLPQGTYLSAQTHLNFTLMMLVPPIGGLLFGLLALWVRRMRAADIVDPVEANALHGGRMSLRESVRLTLATIISNGSGASLGMEAGYTQMGSGIFSWIGAKMRLRRDDERMFVTAGAAAAIAAAFNAPLAGAFYGYELVHGSYTPKTLAPIAVAALVGALVSRVFADPDPLFTITTNIRFIPWFYVLFCLIGVGAAGIAVLTMKSVTWIERGLKSLPLPEWMRPGVGGLLLSLCALGSPQILGSGHGAIQYHLEMEWPLYAVAALLIGKIVASAISLGAGLRGGLFSSALFIGCLFGTTFAQTAAIFDPSIEGYRTAFMLVGMGSVAAAIIGAPITMVFLVLESTGDFPITMGVLAGVVISSTIVRLTFGYSFSTWRFHLRGLGIRGAHDIGWIADLTVGSMMRTDVRLAPLNLPLEQLRRQFPLGSTSRIFAVDEEGNYAGMIDVAAIHDADLDAAAPTLVASDLAHNAHMFLLQDENVRIALLRFEDSAAETLPVLAARDRRTVIGYLTEAYALRRYTMALERKRSAELGEQDLFARADRPL